MKVNLHCGENTRSEYSNFDIRPHNNPDLKKAKDYSMIEYSANEIDEMIAHAGTLESMDRPAVIDILKSWYERIKEGGILKISFIDSHPSAENNCSLYLINFWGDPQ